MAKQNPNKANQYRPDPRQSLFLQNYLDPKSETFSNAYQSALKAGYEDEYAKVITSDSKGLEWLSEAVNDAYLLNKAENNLKEFLEMDINNVRTVGDIDVFVRDPQLAKIKQDTTKFVAERLGKHKYSTRNEVSGPDGEPQQIKVTIEDYGNKDNSTA
jgi:hypothetical protein